MYCKLSIGLLWAIIAAGCGFGVGGTSDGVTDEEPGIDDPGDRDDDTGTPTDSGETCGNLADDDGDALVDEGCSCTPGDVRTCYSGPGDRVGVGICTGGTMTCVDNGEFSTWDGICAGEVLPDAVEVDGNGLDDDCDGVVDTGDPGLCPGGLTPTFHDREFDVSYTGSRIDPGDGEPIQSMTCEASSCAAGEVAVDIATCTAPGDEDRGDFGFGCDRETLCVVSPPTCADGTYATYHDGTGWSCDPPCELIVTYGGIYGGERRCAGYPELSCPGGEVPTFALESEQWECRPTCDNGLYDQHYLDGQLVCVPC